MNRPLFYRLDPNGIPIPMFDTLEWAKEFEISNRIVQQETIEGYFVSTVFLAMDHNYTGGDPILFETMVQTPEGEWTEQYRYRTKAEAIAGHERVKALLVHHLAEAQRITKEAIHAALIGGEF